VTDVTVKVGGGVPPTIPSAPTIVSFTGMVSLDRVMSVGPAPPPPPEPFPDPEREKDNDLLADPKGIIIT